MIGFEDTVYTTTENSLFTIICILSSDNLGSVVAVNIELVDGSAESEVSLYKIHNKLLILFYF